MATITIDNTADAANRVLVRVLRTTGNSQLVDVPPSTSTPINIGVNDEIQSLRVVKA